VLCPMELLKCPELAALTSYWVQHMFGAIPLVAAARRLWVKQHYDAMLHRLC
jgi:hypothetical protein